MKNSIYKTPWGSYIDLERLVSVSAIQRVYGGFDDMAFYMRFQLMEKPIGHGISSTAGCFRLSEEDAKIKTRANVADLQSKVDTIIKAWKEYKEE